MFYSRFEAAANPAPHRSCLIPLSQCCFLDWSWMISASTNLGWCSCRAPLGRTVDWGSPRRQCTPPRRTCCTSRSPFRPAQGWRGRRRPEVSRGRSIRWTSGWGLLLPYPSRRLTAASPRTFSSECSYSGRTSNLRKPTQGSGGTAIRESARSASSWLWFGSSGGLR